MTWKIVDLVFSRGYSPARRTLLALALHANDDGGSIYPSVATLAREAGISPDTVRRNIKVLKQDGLLELVGQRKCSYGLLNEYRLNLSAIRALPEIRRVGAKASERPAACAAPPLAQCDPSQTATTRTAPPNPSQSATQLCQESIASSSSGWRAHPWMKAIFEVAGPGLADPNKDHRVWLDLSGRIASWQASGWSLEDDVLPVVEAKTAKPRASPMFSFQFLAEDIAKHRARRLQPAPTMEVSNECSGQGKARFLPNGAGDAGGRSRMQHRGDDLLAAAARIRARQEGW